MGLRAFLHHDDPQLAAGNFVAVVIAWNQPFYPLYLWLILGDRAWLATPDVASALAFLSIPLLARRWPLVARIALPVFGIVNTFICTLLLGEASGVALFLLPCAMLAAMLFPQRQRAVMVAIATLPLLAWLALRGRLPGPVVAMTPEEAASVFTMNAISAGVLMIFLGWVLSGLFAALESRRAGA